MNLERHVFEQINSIARDASDMYGSEIECGGFLFSDNNIIKTTRLPPIQYVTESSCNLSRHFREMYIEAYENNEKLVGMWHSHGSHRNSHTGYDDSCLKNFLRNIEQCNESLKEWNAVKNNNTLDIFNMHKGYRLELDSGFEDVVKGVREKFRKGFLSIIVNSRTYRDGENNYDAVRAYLKNGNLVKKNARIRFVNSSHSYDLGRMIVCNGKRLSECGNYTKWKYRKRFGARVSNKGNVIIEKGNSCLEIIIEDYRKAEQFREMILDMKELPAETLLRYRRDKIEEGEVRGKMAREERISQLLSGGNYG